MKFKYLNITIYSLVVLALTGCMTPEIRLTNPKTKDSVVCGGHSAKSWGYGMFGYKWQEREDSVCVKTYQNQGYVFQGMEQ